MIRTDAENDGQRRRGLSTRDIVFLWGPALIWMGAIFYVASVNTWTVTPKVPEWQGLRKLAHIAEYAVLALLVGRALLGTWTTGRAEVSRALMRRVWIWGATISGLYAVSDEVHQGTVPGREFHWEDITIDTLAGIAALGIWYIVYVELKKRKARDGAHVAVRGKSG
ncbi:MAG: VanZ family protein [Chloroflexota bacterium]|nr:VanZ family protein [Chloroflexota bacterium]MDQ5865155.1 VanZ family protein [Chloroflexota bacterium]